MKTQPDSHERLLVLVRHAQAGDPERFHRETGRPDRERPLTADGRERNRTAAAGLHRLLGGLDHLWSSPYVRARQTADDIGEIFGQKVETPDFLLPPWDPGELARWLEARLAPGQTGMLVGHEPDLSFALGRWLCGGTSRAPVPMEKGAACVLRISGEIAPGAVELIWKLPQYGLRKL